MIDFTADNPLPFRDVARLFGKSEQTIVRWTRRAVKPLSFVRVGKTLYTTRTAVQHFAMGDVAAVTASSSPTHQESMRMLREEHGMLT